jgi:hypothetical protein
MIIKFLLPLALLVSVCKIESIPNAVEDHFDYVEVNHYVGEYGEPRFCQLIFWNWLKHDRKYRVQAWIMMKKHLKKTKEGEEKFEAWKQKMIDDYSNIQTKQEIGKLEYKGDFIGGPMYPQKLGDRYIITCYHEGTFRKIYTKRKIDTYTTFDPERRDRTVFPEELRSGLSKSDPISVENVLDDLDWGN